MVILTKVGSQLSASTVFHNDAFHQNYGIRKQQFHAKVIKKKMENFKEVCNR